MLTPPRAVASARKHSGRRHFDFQIQISGILSLVRTFFIEQSTKFCRESSYKAPSSLQITVAIASIAAKTSESVAQLKEILKLGKERKNI